MLFRPVMFTCLFLLGAVASAQAAPGQPDFAPALYADGELWGTKFAATLPPANAHNQQSFDGLFVILNGVAGHVPVAEAAPGNPDYNGGRWATYQVTWLEEPVLLTSYADILYHEDMNNLVIVDGTFPMGPPPFFECPLLPVK